ncbi:MAG TPA: DUF4440 domain-containing protein [Chitinophagaceae bacterium]|nr:DUF4440 domain-containing protein [Chitinophagaceae bacterium]
MKSNFFLVPLLVLLLFTPALLFSQVNTGQLRNDDEMAIRNILNEQTTAWNRGDIQAFMQGYWKNDSLMFIGKSGVNWGWERTLANYKRAYPDTTKMGKLSFEIIVVKPLSSDYYYAVGKWMLRRTIGDLSGYYNLLFEKINGHWVIVADHSS